MVLQGSTYRALYSSHHWHFANMCWIETKGIKYMEWLQFLGKAWRKREYGLICFVSHCPMPSVNQWAHSISTYTVWKLLRNTLFKKFLLILWKFPTMNLDQIHLIPPTLSRSFLTSPILCVCTCVCVCMCVVCVCVCARMCACTHAHQFIWPVCVGRLLQGMEPAVRPLKSWHSLSCQQLNTSRSPARVGASCSLSFSHAGLLSGWSLCWSCEWCHQPGEFLCAAALLCPGSHPPPVSQSVHHQPLPVVHRPLNLEGRVLYTYPILGWTLQSNTFSSQWTVVGVWQTQILGSTLDQLI